MKLIKNILKITPFIVATCCLATQPIQQHIDAQNSFTNLAVIPPQPKLNAKAFVLFDVNSGMILASKNSDKRLAPASLTKLMGLYLIANALQLKQINLDDKVLISTKAWKTGGSRMFIKAGSKVKVTDLIKGMVVASGNDATIAMAEHIAGTESAFVNMMNQTAKTLHMNNTHFTDATGLPTTGHYSTAKDLAILTSAIIRDFPQYYHWYNQKWINYNKIRQFNRNRLLWRDERVDGLKTGSTDAAGYCLIASGKSNNMRLVSVIMGTPSKRDRVSESEALLSYGFRFFTTERLYHAKKSLAEPRVWEGKSNHTKLGVTEDLFITFPKNYNQKLKVSLQVNPNITAPIEKGNTLGHVVIKFNDHLLNKQQLVALENNPRTNWINRMFDKISHLFNG